MDHYQLVKDCLKEKPAAQKQLYQLFAGGMLGICYRYTKSMADAEDVLQEGFIKVFKNLHIFQNMLHYVYRNYKIVTIWFLVSYKVFNAESNIV